MRWKIGEFEFDSLTRQISPSDGKPLGRKTAEVLGFLIHKAEKEETDYNNDEIMTAIWNGSDSAESKSLHTAIHKLRKKFGGPRESYIGKDPYRLVKTPVRIGDDTIARDARGTSDFPAFAEAGKRQDSQSSTNQDFTLIVDGMIINSVAELLFEDQATDGIRRGCAASYERSLEDLAFATVYAHRLVTSKDFRPSIVTPDQPGQEVAARLGKICDQRAYPSEITDGRLLQSGTTREGIRADIQRLAKCVADKHSVHFFRDYMVREAAKHLGTHDTVFQEDFDPDKYKFDVARPYYMDRELQNELGTATDTLVGFLPKSPQNTKDPYATNALREFATRNVLSLITIMWESDVFAEKTGAWRMPHVLRALVVRKRFSDRAGTQRQQLVRDLVVEHALATALEHMRRKSRSNIMAALLELRDEYPFKQIRELLNQTHMMFVEPGPKREENARQVLRQLKTLTASAIASPDNLRLVHRSALRTSDRSMADRYEDDMYRVFPELRPNKA